MKTHHLEVMPHPNAPELYPGQFGNTTANQFVNKTSNAPELYPGQFGNTTTTPMSEPPPVEMPDEPIYHWYYKVLEKSYNVLNPT